MDPIQTQATMEPLRLTLTHDTTNYEKFRREKEQFTVPVEGVHYVWWEASVIASCDIYIQGYVADVASKHVEDFVRSTYHRCNGRGYKIELTSRTRNIHYEYTIYQIPNHQIPPNLSLGLKRAPPNTRKTLILERVSEIKKPI